jgi:hypothetical protein
MVMVCEWRWFVNGDGAIVTVATWFQALDQDFFAKGFEELFSRWDKYLNRDGDYVEKYYNQRVCKPLYLCGKIFRVTVSCLPRFSNIPRTFRYVSP